jgi:hypothetical protein
MPGTKAAKREQGIYLRVYRAVNKIGFFVEDIALLDHPAAVNTWYGSTDD